MHKIEERDKRKFYDIIMELHSQGLSYIDSVCKVVEILDLQYNEVVRLLDPTIRAGIKKEAIDRRLLKGKNDDLSFLFKEG